MRKLDELSGMECSPSDEVCLLIRCVHQSVQFLQEAFDHQQKIEQRMMTCCRNPKDSDLCRRCKRISLKK